MKRTITTVILILVLTSLHVKSQVTRSEFLFDNGWKFFKGDIKGAEKPSFNDRSWRAEADGLTSGKIIINVQ
jgi:hypothetical protein